MLKANIGRNLLHSAVIKILISAIVCAGLVTIVQLLLAGLLQNLLNKETKLLVTGVAVAAVSLLAYTALFTWYEKRSITELSTRGLAKNLALGIAIGALLQCLTLLVMYANGAFTIVAVNSFLFVLPALGMAFTSSVFEEILFRGILFRLTEQSLGSYAALAISAAIFGAMHLANPHSTPEAALGLAIQAGLLLGAAYMFTRNLWFPIAIHFAWNFTQSGIFGASTSGNAFSKSLFTTQTSGADWLTGGKFGPEGSVQATIFCLLATVVLMWLNHRKKNIIRPYWKR